MPILVLSAVGEEEQKVRALEAGADDYVTKPFGSRELVARLQRRAAARRPRRGAAGDRSPASWRSTWRHARCGCGGEPVHLTPIEFDLLRVLARNRGRLMTHRALLAEVWGPEYVDDVADAAHAHSAPARQDRAGGADAALHRHRPRRRLSLFRIAG